MKKIILALVCALPFWANAQEWVETPGTFAPGTQAGMGVTCHAIQGDTVFYGGTVATPAGVSNSLWQWTVATGLQPIMGLPTSPNETLWCMAKLGQDSLFVGGTFGAAGAVTLQSAAIVTPGGYQPLSGPSGYQLGSTAFSGVSVHHANLWRDTLYVSGQFQVLDNTGTVVSTQSLAKWHPATGILPLTANAVQGVTSEVVGDTLFVNTNNGLLERLSLVTGQWASPIELYITINGAITPGYSVDMMAWKDTLVMAGSYYFSAGNEELLLGYYQGQLFNMDQGQTGYISILGIDSLQGEIALSGLSLSGYPEVIRSGTSWIPLGNQISFLVWGAVEHASGIYCYGDIYFSTSNCPPPVHIATLSSPCGPLTFPNDSVEVIEEEPLATALAYPNPTDRLVTIEVPAGWEGVRVSVSDMTGRNILPTREIASGDKVDLSLQPAGIYLLRIVAADGRGDIKRIIRQ